jgi:hypothetical protein
MNSIKAIYSRKTQIIIQIIILFSSNFLFSVNSVAQIAVFGGANYCTVRNDVLLKNKKPIIASDLGVSVQYHPLKRIENLSLINELSFSRKGYDQNLEGTYSFRFNYLVLPILINYKLLEPVSVQTGIELSSLLSTSIRQGLKTYNNFDTGLVFGLSFQQGRILSFYLRGVYGLLPMLDYYSFDELGNFTVKIHDLKNMCISVGIKINIYNEKFRLYK